MTTVMTDAIQRGWRVNATAVPVLENWSVLEPTDSGWCGQARNPLCFFLPVTPCTPPSLEVIHARMPIYLAHTAQCIIGAGFLPAGDHEHGQYSDPAKWTTEIRIGGQPLVESQQWEMPALSTAELDLYRLVAPLGGPIYQDPRTKWFTSGMVAFINRPNFRFTLLLDTLHADFMARHGNPSFGYGSSSPCAAIHVRHGDKLKELARGFPDRASFNHSGLEYVAKARALGAHNNVTIRTIFVMTDDDAVIDDLSKMHADVRFLYVDSVRHRVDELLDNVDTDVFGARAGNNAAAKFGELYLAVQLAAKCEYAVVNTASTIAHLLLSFSCWKQKCPKIYDMSGD